MAQLLEISTLEKRERNTVGIDGKEYALKDGRDFNLQQSVKLESLGNLIDKHLTDSKKEDIGEKAALDLDATLDEMLTLLLVEVGRDIVAKLNMRDKLAIISAFTSEDAKRRAFLQKKTKPKGKGKGSTSASFSRR